MLENFVIDNIPCLGVEPSDNVAKVATEKGIEPRKKPGAPAVRRVDGEQTEVRKWKHTKSHRSRREQAGYAQQSPV